MLVRILEKVRSGNADAGLYLVLKPFDPNANNDAPTTKSSSSSSSSSSGDLSSSDPSQALNLP